MRISSLFLSALLVLTLAACSTVSQSKYYTLQTTPYSPHAPAVQQDDAGGASSGARPDFAISVQYVQLPGQVDRPQLVLSDGKSTEVTLLNDSQWASPLADEIRYALINDLSARLNVLDVPLSSVAGKLPVWVIDVDVQRFESVYNQFARLSATWRLTPRHQESKNSVICQADVSIPVEDGVEALVAGHQQGLALVSAMIAEQLSGQDVLADGKVAFKGCSTLSATNSND